MIVSPKRMTRSEILKKFHDQVEQGIPIIGGGAGIGLSAKCEELGGIDHYIQFRTIQDGWKTIHQRAASIWQC